jgi:hypothetical protein
MRQRNQVIRNQVTVGGQSAPGDLYRMTARIYTLEDDF